jgi:hypothetical protein
MQILTARVDWNDEFDNPASLIVEIDRLPQELLRYERKGRYLFAEAEGYVSFFYDDPGDHHGYGGRDFKLTMKDGTITTLIGPWSGNPAGAAAAGFPMSYDCRADVWEVNPNGPQYAKVLYHYGIQLTEPVWLAAVARCPDAEAVPSFTNAGCAQMGADQNRVIGCLGDPDTVAVYEIARKGMTVAQTRAYKRAVRFTRYLGEVHESNSTWQHPLEDQLRMAKHVNELVSTHGLEAFGLKTVDLSALPPLLPARREQTYSYDPEEEPDDSEPSALSPDAL